MSGYSNPIFALSVTKSKPLSAKGIKLSKIRIIQKNIVYIIGLSPQLADENIMRKFEFLGQYGKVLQITLNKDKAYS